MSGTELRELRKRIEKIERKIDEEDPSLTEEEFNQLQLDLAQAIKELGEEGK
jgi:hypothetical protein